MLDCDLQGIPSKLNIYFAYVEASAIFEPVYESIKSVIRRNRLLCIIAICILPFLIRCSTTAKAVNEDKLYETIDCSSIKSIFCSPAFHTTEWDLKAWEQLREEARNMTPELLRQRIAAGANVNERRPIGGDTPLMWIAAYSANPETVQVLIDAGADVNAHDDHGGTALCWAVSAEVVKSTPDIVRILLKAGTEVEIPRYYTPLTSALMRLRRNENPAPVIESIKALLNAGADVNSGGWLGLSPLMVAVTHEVVLIEVVKLLIDAGADVNAHRDSYTVLMYAVVSTQKRWPTSPIPLFNTQTTEIVDLLIDAGADVNAQSKDGWTALMVAARWRTPEFVQILIDAGADMNVRNNEGQTALMLAKEGGHTQIVELLRKAGAEE
jgi:ankyrin repeat protein